jgi:hypothetical protein
MKEDKVVNQPSVDDAQALLGVAVAGDPDLESALSSLVTQANRKSKRKGTKFENQVSEFLDHKVEISESRLGKSQAKKHHERCSFADGKTLRECAESTFYNWDDLKYDFVTMGYLKIVDGPVLSHHHEED